MATVKSFKTRQKLNDGVYAKFEGNTEEFTISIEDQNQNNYLVINDKTYSALTHFKYDSCVGYMSSLEEMAKMKRNEDDQA